MRTARQLHESMFRIRIENRPASRQELFPGWGGRDRFGVVVMSRFGRVGAGHLLHCAITAFCDAKASRRAGLLGPGTKDPAAVYPDVFVLHVGGRWGNHRSFGVRPARKEVFVSAHPCEVLDATDDRGMARLTVPDGPGPDVVHELQEPAAARDRVTSAFAYSPTGRVPDADVAITGLTEHDGTVTELYRRIDVDHASTLLAP